MNKYPGRLYHRTPGWVRDGALFHLRLRADPGAESLVEPRRAADLLRAAHRYHELGRWWCELLLVMPDHVHALLAFPGGPGMSEVIRSWKRGITRFQGVRWQEGYFDHRLRTEEDSRLAWHYLRRNPIVRELCIHEDDWPWWWSAVQPNPLFDPSSPPGGPAGAA